jgi:RNA polymerase sigma-70 factor (ECF subfamily)
MAARAVAPHPASTPALLESAQWAAIYEDHSRWIYYLALRFLGDPAQAEDATHDVFLKAFRKSDQFKGRSCVRTWLYSIAIHHCQTLLQSWHHRHIQCAEDTAQWETTGSLAHSPLRVLETKELGARIQKTLDALSPEYRLLLLLVADEQLSYDEIAALTRQSPDAVRGKLHRARKAFAGVFATTA